MKKYIPGLILILAAVAILYMSKAHTSILAQEEPGGVATDSSRLTEVDIPEASASATLIPVPTGRLIENGEVLSAENIFIEKGTEEIVVDPTAPNTCEFSPFSKTVKKGTSDTFTFQAVSSAEASIIKNVFFTGDLPTGVSSSVNTAASKTGHGYEVVVDVAATSQTGSFSIPLIYKEITNKEEEHTTMCQFNLVIEQ
jgi:hypothetical protein